MLMIGSKVLTPEGQVRVQALKIGDLVVTKHNGNQPVSWVGRKQVNPLVLKDNPEFNAIFIEQNAFGKNLPDEDLFVSQQNRLVHKSSLTSFGALTRYDGVNVDNNSFYADYIHIMFEQHETIFVNGLEVESFHPGQPSFEGTDLQTRLEMFALYPQLDQLPNVFGKSSRSGEAHTNQ